MNLKTLCFASCAALLSLALLDLPAGAAPKKKNVVTRTTHVAVAKRAPTRVRVAPRSFMDPGTEVLPGEEKYMNYALPPNYSPTGVIDNTAFSRPSSLPGPFDLPGRRNPYGFQVW